MSHEKYSKDEWREEFEQSKLNVRVNKNLIKELTDSINCSYRQICRIIGDEQNSYLTKGKVTANANYSLKIRPTADFLAVPPWLIFSEEGNENIKGLYENTEATIFKTYNISSIGDSIRKIKNGLSRKTNLKQEMINKYNKVLDEINEVFSSNGEHIEDSWEEIFKFLKEEFKKDKVDWGCHISLNNGSFTGTLRITKWIELDTKDNTKIKDRFSSAWLYYKDIDNNQPYEEELLILLNDISKLIGKPFWQFSVSSSSNSKANLCSWHSNRELDNEQYKKIAEKLPLSPNFMTSPEPVICLIPNFYRNEKKHINDSGDINEFVGWLEDTKNIEDSSNIHTSVNYLKFLLDENYLKENDRLIFKYENDFKNFSNKAVCTLVIHNGEPRVKWGYDDNIYSISSLSKQLLLESNRIGPTTNPDGNKYWRLESSNATSLYDVAINIKSDIESGQLKLF